MDNIDQTPLVNQTANLGAVADPTAQMPDEIKQLLAQLPNWISQRKDAMDDMKSAYDNDPRLTMTPFQAKLHGIFDSGATTSSGMVKNGYEYQQAQQAFLSDRKIQRDQDVMKNLDLNTFDKLYKTVTAHLGNQGKRYDTKVLNNGTLAIVDNMSGLPTIIAADQFPFYQKAFARYYETYSKQGGYTASQMQEMAHNSAINELNNGNQVSRQLPNDPAAFTNGQIGIAGSGIKNPNAATVNGTLPISPVQSAPVTTPIQSNDIKLGTNAKLEGSPIPYTPEQLAAIASDMNKGKPSSNSQERALLTPAQQKAATDYAGTTATDAAKEATQVIPQKLQDFGNMRLNILPMESSVLSGDLNTGPAHEMLSQMGGFMNYFDSDHTLAKSTNNDQLYFGNLMNIARDKIKALGSGTAVSNLDLITTLKSLGDLRNNPQGILKLTGLLNYMSLLQEDKLKSKKNWIEEHHDLNGWTPDTNNFSHALTYKRVSVPNSDRTLWKMVPISKEDMFANYAKTHNGELPTDQQWNSFAKKSFAGSADIDSYIDQYNKSKVK